MKFTNEFILYFKHLHMKSISFSKIIGYLSNLKDTAMFDYLNLR